jgi:hypothetical protein
MRWIVPLLVLALALLSAKEAFADPTSDAARIDAAKRHFDVARAQFTLGNYAAALVEFDAAYALDPRPLLLYNAGLAARSAGSIDVAQDRLRHFVRDALDGRERDDALVYLDELKTLAGRRDRREVGGATTSSPPIDTAPTPAAPTPAAPAASPLPPAAPSPSKTATPPAAGSIPPAKPLAQADVSAATVKKKRAAMPLYRRWWLWSAVAAATAGIAVGLGVGLAPKPWSPNLAPVSLHSGSLTLRF